MVINHVISSIDKSSGGPARSVSQLISGILEDPENYVNLTLLQSDNPILKTFDKPNGKIQFLPREKFGFSKKFQNCLTSLAPDIYHGHCLWQWPVHQMATTARKRNIPYVISPRGMLDPWPLQHKKLKKEIALKFFQHKDITNAACLHATAPMEAENIRKLGYRNPIAIIPNGISLKDFPVQEKQLTSGKKKLLLLARLVKNKGIEELIQAWSIVNISDRQNWQIDIVGNGETSYLQYLRKLIKQKNLCDCILISGPKYGKDKLEAYRDANLFVLPTYTENFGISIAEALASGIPVITTKGTPWEDLARTNSGWWIDIGVEPLVAALEIALRKAPEELKEMGVNGRKLIEDKYSIPIISAKMVQLYNWILNAGQKPEFILNDKRIY